VRDLKGIGGNARIVGVEAEWLVLHYRRVRRRRAVNTSSTPR
jgi:hypothetical protein